MPIKPLVIAQITVTNINRYDSSYVTVKSSKDTKMFHSRTYSGSIFIVQMSTNFNFADVRSNLKRIAYITTCNGICQTVFCRNKTTLNYYT